MAILETPFGNEIEFDPDTVDQEQLRQAALRIDEQTNRERDVREGRTLVDVGRREAQEAQQTFGIPIASSSFPGAARALAEGIPREIPFEEAGNILGAGLGATAGTAVAPGPGTVAAGIAGGIAGGAFGRRLDIITGKTDPESQLSTLSKVVGEEALSAGAGAVAKPVFNAIGKPVLRGISRLAQNTSLEPIVNTIFKNPQKSVQQTLLTTADIDTNALRVVTIDDAANRLLGENVLTPFEQSGGKAAKRLQQKLNFAVQDMMDKNLLGSTALKTREQTTGKLRNVLAGIDNTVKGENFTRRKRIVGVELKKQFNKALDNVKAVKNPIAQAANNLGARAKADVGGLLDEINALKQDAIIQTKSPDRVKVLFDSLNKGLTPPKPRVSKILDEFGQPARITTPISKDKTFLELDIIDNRARDKLTEFNANLNVQDDKVAAWYKANVVPLIRQRKATAADIAGDGSTQANALAAGDKLREILDVQDLITNNQLGRSVGIAEFKQKAKQLPAQDVLGRVFDTPENWDTTKRLLELSNPDLIPILRDRFKLDLLAESFDPKVGEVTFDRLMAIRKKHGDDLINKVAGEQYVNDITDASLIARALDSTSGLANLNAGIPIKLEDKAAGLFRPMQQKVTIFQAIMGGLKDTLGLKALDDKFIFQKLQGDKGLRLLEKLQTTPLDGANSYLAYVEFARALGIRPIIEGEYTEKAKSMINLLSNFMSDNPPQEQIQQQ